MSNRGWTTYSPDRVAYLRGHFETKMPLEDITAALNKMDGPKVSSDGVATKANSLGLRRPERVAKFSPERRAFLEENYDTMMSISDLVAAINAMPGAPITKEGLRACANKWGFRRPACLGGGSSKPRLPPRTWATSPDENLEPEEVDVDTAILWGHENKCGSNLGAINAARRALGLPPFRVRRTETFMFRTAPLSAAFAR